MKSRQESQKIRLNKLIAESGLVSRRKADELIENGQVQVNGRRVYELGTKVDPNNDKILVNGKPLRKFVEKYYFMFNKPLQVLTSMNDPSDRPIVADYFKKIPARLFPVGRLDWNTEGLLLMTNDGEFANAITHPKFEVTKTYLAKVAGEPNNKQLEKLVFGVTIPTGKVSAKSVKRMPHTKGKYDWLRIVITEGHNRQVRHMLEKIGCDVLKLQRIAIGQLKLGSLKSGDFKPISAKEIDRIFSPDNEN